MKFIEDELRTAKKIIISGHVRPDGDCVGSCLALYNYLCSMKSEFPLESIKVVLEEFSDSFFMLHGADKIEHIVNQDETCDLFISLDCGSIDRLGEAIHYYETAKETINIDHHISNQGFAMKNHIVADASSTCEVLYALFDKERINKDIAACLYLGIIHDTGVFKHSNTSRSTLEAAGALIEKGIPFSKIIDESFYQKTYLQNKILGHCLLDSELELNGACIVSVLKQTEMQKYGVVGKDLDGIIDQLRITEGVEVAIFIYELEPDTYKVSMRANGDVNVSEIAVSFGGGGHVKAAGATMQGDIAEIIGKLLDKIAKQL